MPLKFANLDERTRKYMLEEIEMDAQREKIYVGSYLSDIGRDDWRSLIEEAARAGSAATLAVQLRQKGRLSATAPRKTKNGITMVNVPVTANETLAEGEFNRFYIRALCRCAIEDGISQVEVYRAKQVDVPRPESEAKIGALVDPAALLEDLRESVGVSTATGFPGPNSGLSVKLA